MDVYLFDQRSLTGRNAAFRIVAERLERAQDTGGSDAPVVWRVDGSASLRRTLPALAAMIADRRAAFVRLRIIAHGRLGQIELGAEGVSSRTCALFAALAGRVRRVELHCCNVAAIQAQTISLVTGINTENEVPNPDSGSFLRSRAADAEFAARLDAGYATAEDQRALREHAGIALVRSLAHAMGAPVVAAMRFQTLSIHQWDFEGPTITAGLFAGAISLNVPARDELFPRLRPGSYSFSLTDLPRPMLQDGQFVRGVPVSH